MSEVRRLIALSGPYRGALALAAGLLLAESAAALAIPWIAGRVAESILADTAAAALPVVLALLLSAFAAQALLRFGAAWTADAAVDSIVADLKTGLYDHLQSLPLAWFQQRRLGESVALLTTDVYVVAGWLGGTAVALVPLAATGLGAVVLMLGIRAELALLVLAAVPAVLLAFKVAGRRIRPLSHAVQGEEASAVALAQENLALLPAIKLFAREPRESARYREQVGRILALAARQRRVHAAFTPLVQFLAGAGVVALLALAGNSMTAAELVTFLLYAHLLVRPVAGLADVYGQTQVARAAYARLAAVLDLAPEPLDRGVAIPAHARDIEWRGVTFAYEGREPALAGLDLSIRAGEWVAIVGPNGAGKSTLGHLLLRLHAPSSGRVFVGGVDLATASAASLREHIGVVPQHVMLFHASVRDNIAYGRPDADDGAIERAARQAGVHEFASRLPQGYATVVGDQGVRLSGGQQQRIALARALVKEPAILLLDEATALFDPEAERDFLRACRDALPRATVLFITHRPGTLDAADRIVHLREGRVERIEERRPGLRLVGS